ncbi:MAG: protein kinase, partial [Myxococcales bacterium]|nr:protein kinase [Myxococcales bacterium]
MLPRVWICPECRSIYNDPVGRCPRDEAPVAEVQAHQTKARYPLLGKVVGDRYHLIGGLGQGGLGTVYLAQHLHLEQLFAVKFLDLETLGVDVEKNAKDTYRRDFMKEARVASLIRHESVVRVSDFGEHDGLPFLVMEYVPGPSLLQLMGQKGRLEMAEAINIARRIAEALDAFHERRLVHRDLKPANVIL